MHSAVQNYYETAIIHRIENPQPTDGCGYVIKLETGDEEKIYKILSQAGISVTGVERE